MAVPIITLNFTEKGIDSAIKKNAAPFTLKDEGGSDSYVGLTLQVTKRSKTYIVNKKINGKTYRRKVGLHPDLSPKLARNKARELVNQIQDGNDPKIIKALDLAKEKVLNLSIQNALDEFLSESPKLAASTKEGYRDAIKISFEDYKKEPIFSISPETIIELHDRRSDGFDDRKGSKAKADHDMRTFRLLWNWAVNKYKKDYPEISSIPNPVSEALNSGHRAGVKGWHKVPRKQSIIPRKKLNDWFTALNTFRIKPSKSKTRESVINLTETLVLTGLRFSEAATLKWGNVDPVKEILIIPDSTSKNRQELIKPITERISEILEIQKNKDDEYVFPGLDGPIKDTRDFRDKLIAQCGISFTNHDLRRVYLSAGSRAEVPENILKRLVNHLPKNEDVTAGYIIQSLDELQEYAQRIEDQILTDAGIKDRSIDNTLISLLGGLSEDEKRKMIFKLSRDLVAGGEK